MRIERQISPSLFFLIASVALFVEQSKEFSYIPLIGGAIAEFISAVNFFLYSRASSQLTTFHQRLEGAQQYINIFNLADDVCEKIQGNLRDEIRAELVRKIAELPEKLSNIAEDPINNKNGTNYLDSKVSQRKARHKKIESAKDGSTPKQATNSATE